MGKIRFRVADEIDDVALDVSFRGAGNAYRLIERNVDLFFLRFEKLAVDADLVAIAYPGTQRGNSPVQVTRPASIHLSASRREQSPVSLMYLLSLTNLDHRRLRLRLEESAYLLCQSLRRSVEQIGGILGEVDELRVGQGARGPLRVVADARFDPQHQAFLLDDGQPIDGRQPDQYQAADEFRASLRPIRERPPLRSGIRAVSIWRNRRSAARSATALAASRKRIAGAGSDSPQPGKSGA